MSKVKQLEKKFGGRWKYRGSSTWECLDDKRMVWAVHQCSCDNERCLVPPKYYLYGDEKPIEVHWDKIPVTFAFCTEPPSY